MFEEFEDDKWYEVVNLEEVVDFLRKLVYESFDETTEINSLNVSKKKLDVKLNSESQRELDDLLSMEECLCLVKPLLKSKRDKEYKTVYMLNTKIFFDIVADMNSRMISNILRGLVDRNEIEIGFSDSKNDFIFWVKDDKHGNFPTDNI
tara:strand:+ start:109 stop:555 length:447 start_codon:yes stop_codon:yes gene_type:complete